MRQTTCYSSLLSDKRYLALIATFFAGMGQGVVSPEMPDLVGTDHGSVAVTIGVGAFLLYAGIFFLPFDFPLFLTRGK